MLLFKVRSDASYIPKTIDKIFDTVYKIVEAGENMQIVTDKCIKLKLQSYWCNFNGEKEETLSNTMCSAHYWFYVKEFWEKDNSSSWNNFKW